MILIACGLSAEADIAAKGAYADSVRTVAGGGSGHRLLAELSQLADEAAGILSFGIAGGLDDDLDAGDVRLASAVVATDGERYATDEAWTAAMVSRVGCPPPMLLAGADTIIRDPAGKAELRRRTGASLVDMESAIAARVAQASDRPFAALRVVSDRCDRTLPPAVEVSMKPGGGLDLPAIFLSIARDPRQIPGLIQTGRDSRKAFAALLRSRQLLGPGFALLDLG